MIQGSARRSGEIIEILKGTGSIYVSDCELMKCLYTLLHIRKYAGVVQSDEPVISGSTYWIIHDIHTLGARPKAFRTKYTMRLQDGRELDFLLTAGGME